MRRNIIIISFILLLIAMILFILIPNQFFMIDDEFNDEITKLYISLMDYLRHLPGANKYEIVL